MAQFVFLKGNEKPSVTYAKEREIHETKGVTLPKSLISLMQKLIIKGEKELNGKISVSGSKNATLPILAACILTSKAKLKNIPLVRYFYNDRAIKIYLSTKMLKKIF